MATNATDPIFWGLWRDTAFARNRDPNIYRWGFFGNWPSFSVREKRALIRGLLERSPMAVVRNAHSLYVALAASAGNTESALNYAADAIARAIDADNLRRLRNGIPVPGINDPRTTGHGVRSFHAAGQAMPTNGSVDPRLAPKPINGTEGVNTTTPPTTDDHASPGLFTLRNAAIAVALAGGAYLAFRK